MASTRNWRDQSPSRRLFWTIPHCQPRTGRLGLVAQDRFVGNIESVFLEFIVTMGQDSFYGRYQGALVIKTDELRNPEREVRLNAKIFVSDQEMGDLSQLQDVPATCSQFALNPELVQAGLEFTVQAYGEVDRR